MGAELERLQEEVNWHWRNSMRPVRFFAFDVRAAMPFALLLVYFRWSTIILAIVTVVVFRIMEGRGLTFSASLRALRGWFTGKKRPGLLPVEQKKFKVLP